MEYLKKILPILFLFFLVGCAPFSKNNVVTDYEKITENNFLKLNGKYWIYPKVDSTKATNLYKNLSGVWWCDKKYNLPLNNSNKYYVEIKVLNTSKLNIKVFENEVEIISRIVKGKFKNDMFYINRKLSISGIPYIFGTIEVDRKRIFLKNNSLIIDKVNNEFGAVFIVFTAGFKHFESQEYERVN